MFSRRCLVGGAVVRWKVLSSSMVSAVWRRSFAATVSNKKVAVKSNPSQFHFQSPPSSPPWLMLSSPKHPEFRYFYDVIFQSPPSSPPWLPSPKHPEFRLVDDQGVHSTIKLNRKIHLPQIAGHHCIGSSQGFLITIDFDRSTKIHVTNPLTGSHFTLPPLISFPFYSSFPYNCNDYFEADKAWISPHQNQTLLLDTNYERLYKSKAFLSPSLDILAILNLNPYHHEELLFLCPTPNSLCSHRRHPSPPLPPQWTIGHDSVQDCIFHKGCLYDVMDSALAIYHNIHDLSLPPTLINFQEIDSFHFPEPRYLVESPDGDDLFLVSRTVLEDDEAMDDVGYDENDYDSSLDNPSSTKFFKVLKLEHGWNRKQGQYCKWNRVECLGDLAMFLGYNYSISVSVRDFPNLKPNCIYFTDHLPNILENPRMRNLFKVNAVGDTGVFDMEDGSVQLYQLRDYDSGEELMWPMPVWYTPSSPIC